MAINAEKVRIIVEANTNSAERNLNNLDGQTNSLVSTLQTLAGPAAIGAAVAGIVRLGRESVQAFAVQEQAEARLAATIEATGGAAGLTARELEGLASSLQGVTQFGDEAIIGAESLLLTFREVGEDVFPRALESILDVSEAMGQDLQASTVQLGKALNDPVRGLTALRRVGIQFTAEQEELIASFVESGDVASAQGVILTELENQFGGVARAAAETASGGITQMNNALGDVSEEIGAFITSVGTGDASIVGIITTIATAFANAGRETRALQDALDELGETGEVIGELAQLENDLAAARERQLQPGQLLNTQLTEYIFALQDAIEEERARVALEQRAQALQAQGEAAAAAAAEAEAERQAEISRLAAIRAEDLANLQAAFDQTTEGQIAATEASLAYFETFIQGPMAVAVVQSLRDQLANLRGEQEAVAEEVETLTQEQLGYYEEYYSALENIERDYYANLHEQKLQDIEDDRQRQVEAERTADQILSVVSSTAQAFGTAAATGESFAEALGTAAKSAAATILNTVGERALAEAAFYTAASLVPFGQANIPAAIGFGTAATAAFAGAAAIQAFAGGGSFVTNGPQAILVGDNPGGQEQVDITPIGSQNRAGPRSGPQEANIFLDRQLFLRIVQDGLDSNQLTFTTDNLRG